MALHSTDSVRHQSVLHPPAGPITFFRIFFLAVEMYLLPPLLPEREAVLIPVREADTDLPTEPDPLPERDGKISLVFRCL